MMVPPRFSPPCAYCFPPLKREIIFISYIFGHQQEKELIRLLFAVKKRWRKLQFCHQRMRQYMDGEWERGNGLCAKETMAPLGHGYGLLCWGIGPPFMANASFADASVGKMTATGVSADILLPFLNAQGPMAYANVQPVFPSIHSRGFNAFATFIMLFSYSPASIL